MRRTLKILWICLFLRASSVYSTAAGHGNKLDPLVENNGNKHSHSHSQHHHLRGHHDNHRGERLTHNIDAEPFTLPLELPSSIKSLIINIGSNLDPPMPPENDTSVAVIAVEPILRTAARIPIRERLYTIVCAIADTPRFQVMHTYNAGGLSSSLSRLKNENVWFRKYTDVDPRKGFSAKKNPDFTEAGKVHQGNFQVVPVLPLSMLINSIPESISIIELHTDMQGYDFTAIKSAGKSILRIPKLQTEVSRRSEFYVNTTNDLDKDWVPYMTSIGYKLVEVRGPAKVEEADAFWELEKKTVDQMPTNGTKASY